MADLIDRLALLKEIWSIGNQPWSEWETAGVVNLVNRQTAVDAVPVVRCKDCKRSGMYAFGHDVIERLACLDIDNFGFVQMATSVEPMDFCSYGERKAHDD